ncbi:two-component system sensor histidine kinase YesM [Paenibacillus sp. V4I3]|uniref:sensor histidine kinase n=1 Tax=Paenibacillus sp. V4I3 TaxID=3042305 RepID=UPI002784061E|nr:sensor histidine kinase [Paenibacillus sp. V4I3]MDQ0874530.1 two-component system sensor histidine kinase YesM [Paenibacillus sp. V4I3]
MGRFGKLSLIRQVLYLILIMLIILLISFVISNNIAGRIIERKVTDSVSKILLQVEEKMESFYSDMEGISTSLLYSPTVQTYMSSTDTLSMVLMNSEIISVFSNTITLKENIRGIQLFDKEETLIANIGAGTSESVKFPVESTEYSGVLTYPDSTYTGPYYSISVPIYNLKSNIHRDYRGSSVFIMDVNNFNNILKNAKITAHSRLLLLDQNNKIMASEGNTLNFDTFNIEEWKLDKRYIVQTITLSRTGWKLISVIPKNELLQELDTVQRLNIATYIVMFCMLGLFLFIFFARILKPIKALMDFMKSYPKKGGENRFNVVYHNEIGVLAVNLNKMLDEIDTLSTEIQLTQKQMYEIEIAKKQMEISAFRNQISPHFLYNTMECIRAIAFFYKAQEIADISTSLSNMFRYSVKGNDFVTIQDEISHVKEYAKIIELRFMGRMQVAIEADEDLLEVRTLKMLLQPIVENAVFHGLEKKIDNGTVQITVQKTAQNKVQYVIWDDGYGMEDKQLEELLNCLRQFDTPSYSKNDAKLGIGLSNIYRRIKLFYGDEAEMTIQSKLHLGTTISITFPAQDHSEQLEDK